MTHDQATRKFTATAVRWPAPDSRVVSLPAARAGHAAAAVTAPGSPLFAQPVAPAHGRYTGSASLTLTVAPHAVSASLGISGVVWQVAGLTPGTGNVRAGISYKSFSQVFGGNYGLRLAVVELPSCALTTPKIAACRKVTPLRYVNDYRTEQVSALLPLPGRSAVLYSRADAASSLTSASVVLAATTTAGGDGEAAGTYGATSLKPSGSWAEGGASGSFTYTYPVAVPGASSKLVPSADLTYDSGRVDGQTAATQAQADWAGDGWSSGDSFIEQSFTPCKDAPEGVTLSSADQTEDMCYTGNVLTMSLDGTTTSLVRDDSTGTWRLQDDNGSTVTEETSTDNGTGVKNGYYWVITQRDGTKYYFGMNHLPGWASGDTATDSVDYEPVYSQAKSGDLCYDSATFTTSTSCVMAYRWHLDYVTDTHGDAMAYYYHQNVNYYGQDNSATGAGKYVRDSYLTEIDYGFRGGDAYVSGDIPDKIVYGTSARCVASSCPAISASDSGTAGSDYPDVPYDLDCSKGDSCSVYGPTYWSSVRLTSITTEQYSVSASAYQDVDTYALSQTEPATGDGTSPTLWLASITRTGDDTSAGGSSSAVALPAVKFGGQDLANRVDTADYPGLYRFRIDSVTSETGSVTGISYSLPDACTAGYVEAETASAAASNAKSCYPVYWTPDSAMVMDWFEKYAVTGVTVSDTTGGALAQATGYSYSGGAAWHFDDNEVVQSKYRTYGQFRGYASVTTRTGDGTDDPQTEQVTTYYRGMSDDNDSTAVTLADSQGGTHADADQLAGMPLETTVYDGSGGPVDHSAIYSYWISAATADRSRSGLSDLTANMVATAEVWTRQALTDGGTTTWRYTETDNTYDTSISSADFGLVTYVYAHTVPVNSAYDRCTATTYAPADTSENLTGLVASTETDSVACSGFTEGSVSSAPDGLNTLGAPASVSRPGQVVSATETFYDDTSFSATFPQTTAPTTGDVTMTRKAVTYASGAFTWQTTARATYDDYGRVLDAYDGNGNETVTAYTVNTAGLTTAMSVTNPLSQSTSQTLDPTRGLTLTSTDANGVVTTEEYDALGRTTSVWLDSRATSVEANDTYTYTVSDTGVSGTVAEKMGDGGGYATTVTIVDSLGRTRQTQATTPQGGRLITDELYDSRGWVWKKNNRYWDSSATPALSLVSVADSQIPGQDEYVFNGLGQVVQDISRSYAVTKATTTTVYNGDRTTVIPPAGGVIKSTVTDPLGRTTEIDEYTTAPTLVTPSDTFTGIWYVTGGSTTATTYSYDGHGNQATITDAKGNTWTSVYDLLGDVTSRTDPDAGTTTMTYDGNGNVLSSTDARGDTVAWTYDALNRKTTEYAGSTELAAWFYDNSSSTYAVSGMTYPVGHVTTEISYSGGSAYMIQAKGFNIFGESLGETITIPSAAGASLAGTYTFTHSYTTGIGLPYADKYPAAGGLPAETVIHSYLSSPLTLPAGLGGTVASYAQTTSYDAYGDVTQEEIGSGSDLAYITDTYDPWSLRLTDSLVTRSATTPADVDEESYAYDLSGNITQQVSTRLGSSATSETQCFAYDRLARLTAAWTATDSCAATPSASSDATVGDGLGTSSEYWTTYSYDDLGDLTSQVDHDSVTGGTDTTTTDTYDGNGAGQPHTLTSSAVTGGTTASSAFAYDKSGNMITRDTAADGDQALTWNEAGQLTSVASGTAGTTSYVYDADGNLLLTEDPSSSTLYLPGEQLTATGTTVTGARIIPLPGGGDVVRTGSAASYDFEIPDIRGTSTLYLDSTAQTPTWRQFTPYGASRGTAVTWVDNRGYLGKPADAVTGLTDLGAREYDPVTGQFISPDPVLKPGDPQDFDPYAYAEDNPVTGTDPSGLCIAAPGMLCVGSAPVPPPSDSSGGGGNGGSYSSGGTGTGGSGTVVTDGAWGRPARGGGGCPPGICGPQDNGNGWDFLAGLGDSVISLANGPLCVSVGPLTCASDTAKGGLPSQEFTSWITGRGIDTASSAFTGGKWAGLVTQTAIGGIEAGGEASAGMAAEGGMAAVRQAGLEGEDLAGINQAAKVRIPSATGTAAYRIPDALNGAMLTEVKNVATLSYTNQIQDFYRYSVSNGLIFQLVVRQSTYLSQPMQSLVNSPGVDLTRLLP